MQPFLSLNNISYFYHNLKGETPALTDISFQVMEGEFLAIVGPSGCGNAMVSFWRLWKLLQDRCRQHVRQEGPVHLMHRALYMYVRTSSVPNNLFYNRSYKFPFLLQTGY